MSAAHFDRRKALHFPTGVYIAVNSEHTTAGYRNLLNRLFLESPQRGLLCQHVIRRGGISEDGAPVLRWFRKQTAGVLRRVL